MKKINTIDCEPTWVQVLELVKSGVCEPEGLRKACELVDSIRKVQKSGAKQIILVCEENGTISLKWEDEK